MANIQERRELEEQQMILEELERNRKELEAREDLEPERREAVETSRRMLEEAGIQALPFYKTVEFAENMSPQECAWLEAQLWEMGLLDALVATEEAFAKMDDTTEAKMQKAKNSIANLSIVLGQNLLPIVGNVAEKVAAVVIKVSEFAQANPKLVQTVLKVAAGLAAFKIAGLGAKLGFLHIKSGFTTAKIVLETFKSKAALAQVASAGLVSKLRAAGSGIMSIFGGMGSGLGKVAGLVLKPFSLLGGKLGGILSGLGSVIAKSPLGSIGKFITAGFGKLGGVIAPIGNIFKKVLGPIGKIGSSLLGPLGGIAGKLFPVVGIVTGVITAVQLLRNHFDEVRQ